MDNSPILLPACRALGINARVCKSCGQLIDLERRRCHGQQARTCGKAWSAWSAAASRGQPPP